MRSRDLKDRGGGREKWMRKQIEGNGRDIVSGDEMSPLRQRADREPELQFLIIYNCHLITGCEMSPLRQCAATYRRPPIAPAATRAAAARMAGAGRNRPRMRANSAAWSGYSAQRSCGPGRPP